MKAVTKIQAVDGQLFDNERDCAKYEKMIEKIKSVMSMLNPVPTDCAFSNYETVCEEVGLEYDYERLDKYLCFWWS